MAERKQPSTILSPIMDALSGYISVRQDTDPVTSKKREIATELKEYFEINPNVSLTDALGKIFLAMAANREFVDEYNATRSFWSFSASYGLLETRLQVLAIALVTPNFTSWMAGNINARRPRITQEGMDASETDAKRFKLSLDGIELKHKLREKQDQLISVGITDPNWIKFICGCINQRYLSSIFAYKNLPNIGTLRHTHLEVTIISKRIFLEMSVSLRHDIYMDERPLNSTVTEIHTFHVPDKAIQAIAADTLAGTWATDVRSKLVFPDPDKLPVQTWQELLLPLCAPPELKQDLVQTPLDTPINDSERSGDLSDLSLPISPSGADAKSSVRIASISPYVVGASSAMNSSSSASSQSTPVLSTLFQPQKLPHPQAVVPIHIEASTPPAKPPETPAKI